MENALESVLSSLESRSAKLRKWAEMNIHEREALTQHMRRDAERLLDGLGQFQKAKESSWEASMPAERAKEKCAELWDLLAHVKDTRRSASEALAAKLSDALGEAEKAIGEEAESRREAEAAINRMVMSLRQEAARDLSEGRKRREDAEEKIIRLLEQSCAGVEAALLKNSALNRNTTGSSTFAL
ncbi:hypothetical protein cyc_06532 [Cyclospora cayetanensis]|uniref:Uncharacterized protein n=1 Tax=Cyclospora cayetanensis TaxID=88456 RepID=A0A1D3D4E4_9EIME|nr:hypothetical protein cyc_06532 [Cyclospora cayetanensis]